MVRIAGVDLSRDRRAVVALACIYGIGEPATEKICKDAGTSEDIRANGLTPRDQEELRSKVDKYRIKDDLRHEISLNIKRLVEIGSYRSIRHRRGLPACGQNTKNNTRTCRGSRKK